MQWVYKIIELTILNRALFARAEQIYKIGPIHQAKGILFSYVKNKHIW